MSLLEKEVQKRSFLVTGKNFYDYPEMRGSKIPISDLLKSDGILFVADGVTLASECFRSEYNVDGVVPIKTERTGGYRSLDNRYFDPGYLYIYDTNDIIEAFLHRGGEVVKVKMAVDWSDHCGFVRITKQV